MSATQNPIPLKDWLHCNHLNKSGGREGGLEEPAMTLIDLRLHSHLLLRLRSLSPCPSSSLISYYWPSVHSAPATPSSFHSLPTPVVLTGRAPRQQHLHHPGAPDKCAFSGSAQTYWLGAGLRNLSCGKPSGWFWGLLTCQDLCSYASRPSLPSRSSTLALPTAWNVLSADFQMTGPFLL